MDTNISAALRQIAADQFAQDIDNAAKYAKKSAIPTKVSQLENDLGFSTTAGVADGSITTAKIADGAITPAKLDTAYLPLFGGTMKGAIVATGYGFTGNYFLGRHLSGEGADKYLHAIHLGGLMDNECSFHEYGGIFKFFKNVSGKASGGTLLGTIDSLGWNGPAALTGTPTAPTAKAGTNSTQIATTEFVTAAVGGKANSSDVYSKSEIDTKLENAGTKTSIETLRFTLSEDGAPTYEIGEFAHVFVYLNLTLAVDGEDYRIANGNLTLSSGWPAGTTVTVIKFVSVGSVTPTPTFIPRTGDRGAVAGYDSPDKPTGSKISISVSSCDTSVARVSGAVTLAFTASSENIAAVKMIALKASDATTLTYTGAEWANGGSAPTWGSAGKMLIIMANFIFGKVILSVAHNDQV